jgi:hypothetical protein
VPERIQLRRAKGWRLGTNARAVTRPHYYGNPYRVGDYYIVGATLPFPVPTARGQEGTAGPGLQVVRCASAEQAVVWFRPWAEHALEPAKLELLRGLDLACWCPLADEAGNPAPCHANVLLELANAPEVARAGA